MALKLIYCAPSGSDLTGDGSEANPYRTPAYALRPPSAGGPEWRDHVELRLKAGGIYPHLESNRSGLDGDLLFTITRYGDGPDPILSSVNFQNGGGVNHVIFESVRFQPAPDSSPVGISWNAAGQNFSIQGCSVANGYAQCGVIQLPGAQVPRSILKGRLLNNRFEGSRASSWHFASIADFSAYGNIVENAGSTMLDQGFYFNSNCTDYRCARNVFDKVANCGLQVRSGNMDIYDNIVLRSGFGIATGHGMSSTAGQGSIRDNLILFGRQRPDNTPLSCGIGVCMTQPKNGTPFLVTGNIIAEAIADGPFGGISLGDDAATPYQHEGAACRGTSVVAANNFVKNWGPALRLVENNPGMGITRNTFITERNQTLLHLVNSNAWNNLGIRPFANWLDSSKIMQQNDWASNGEVGMRVEMGWMPGLATIPGSWLPGVDPAYGQYPISEYTDMLRIDRFLSAEGATKEAQADILMSRIKDGSLPVSTLLNWARTQVGY